MLCPKSLQTVPGDHPSVIQGYFPLLLMVFGQKKKNLRSSGSDQCFVTFSYYAYIANGKIAGHMGISGKAALGRRGCPVP